jgi:nucleotide-binding universal stress UspA family protein
MSGAVVIGFDGSDCGEDALALGVLLADATGGRPIVVATYPEDYPIGVGRVDAEWLAFMREQAEAMLAGARAILGERADYRPVSAKSASRSLHEVAEAEDAAVVVVGSGHRGAFGRIFPGSTGERLLQGSAAPVAIAPRGFRARGVQQLATVAVAYLDTAEGRAALAFAAALARRAGARLRVITVVPMRAELFAPVIGRDAEEAYVKTAREGYRRSLDAAVASLPDIDAVGELREGDVADALAMTDPRDADLLVCGSRGYGPVRRILLGGVSSRLVHRAALPAVVVPRGTEEGLASEAGAQQPEGRA